MKRYLLPFVLALAFVFAGSVAFAELDYPDWKNWSEQDWESYWIEYWPEDSPGDNEDKVWEQVKYEDMDWDQFIGRYYNERDKYYWFNVYIMSLTHQTEVKMARKGERVVADYKAGTESYVDNWEIFTRYLLQGINNPSFDPKLCPHEMALLGLEDIENFDDFDFDEFFSEPKPLPFFDTRVVWIGLQRGSSGERYATSGDMTLKFSEDTELIVESPFTENRLLREVVSKDIERNFKVNLSRWRNYTLFHNEHQLPYELEYGAESLYGEASFKPFGKTKSIKHEVPKIISTTEQMSQKAVPYMEFLTDGMNNGENEKVIGFVFRIVNPDDPGKAPLTMDSSKHKITPYNYNIRIKGGQYIRFQSELMRYNEGPGWENGDLMEDEVIFKNLKWIDWDDGGKEKDFPEIKLSDLSRIQIRYFPSRNWWQEREITGIELSYEWRFDNLLEEWEEYVRPHIPPMSEEETEEAIQELKDAGIDSETVLVIDEFFADGDSIKLDRKDFVEFSEEVGITEAFISTALWFDSVEMSGTEDKLMMSPPVLPFDPESSLADKKLESIMKDAADMEKEEQIALLKKHYSVMKYFYDDNDRWVHIDLLDMFGDKAFEFAENGGVQFKAPLTIVDGSAQGETFVDGWKEPYPQNYGVRLLTNGQLIIYDGRKNGTINDPIVLVAKEETTSPPDNSGCSTAGFAGLALLLAAVAVRTFAQKKKD